MSFGLLDAPGGCDGLSKIWEAGELQRRASEWAAAFLCKDCNHRYTVVQRSGTGNQAVKRQALELYLEGLGFRSKCQKMLEYSAKLLMVKWNNKISILN